MKKYILYVSFLLIPFLIVSQDSLKLKNNTYLFGKPVASVINDENKPLILIDGRISNYEIFSKIDVKKIKEVTVLKRDSSAIFAHNSNDGVIILTTKNYKKYELEKLFKLYSVEFMPNIKNTSYKIKGTIENKDKTKLNNVSIINLNLKTATKTDSLGNFEIESNKDDVLLFSKNGYKEERILIENDKKTTVIISFDIDKNEALIYSNDIPFISNLEKQKTNRIIYVLGGMTSGITTDDLNFSKKYNIQYENFGCLAPFNMEKFEKLNVLIFEQLNEEFGMQWQKDLKSGTLGFNKWKEK